MKIKYAKDIAKEIRERGSVQVPEGCITGDAFEEWLRDRSNFKMGIIEQAKELRTIANNLSIGHNIPISLAIERFRQAADTIEALSAKLADMERSAEDCGGGWIACSHKLPNEKRKYWITYFWSGKECVEISNFENGKFDFSVNVKTDIVAWKPCIFPEPYRP